MSSASRRILVVEDDPMINQAVTDRLAAEGYDVVQAWDGPGAVAAYGEHAPDLVVLDVMLPGFDGHEVCRRIQAERPVPVLMLTARDDEADVLVGLGVGADDYLTKPFRMRELVARVAALLRRVERAAELVGPARRSSSATSALDAGCAAGLARRRGGPADADRVRPAGLPGRRARAPCSPASSCWPRSGAGRARPAPARSTAT